MKDRELMIQCLKEMSDQPSGSVRLVPTIGPSDKEQHREHQFDILCDMGLAARNSYVYRITADGYRALENPDKLK